MNSLKYLAPPLLVDAAAIGRDIARTFAHGRSLARNKVHYNSCDGQAVFVIGNGPSLTDINLSLLLPAFPCITCNYFGIHPLAKSLNIVAHCTGDPATKVFNKHVVDGLAGVDAPAYWLHYSSSNYVPREFRSRAFFYLPSSSPFSAHISGYSLAAAALPYQSTVQMSISVALYMGFKRIYLIGCDHDWLCCGQFTSHFYDPEPGVSHPSAASGDFSRFSYSDMIDISGRLFSHYRRLGRVAGRLGAKIVNASSKSYLDVFERGSYERCISEEQELIRNS
jgi:hypothetical protein